MTSEKTQHNEEKKKQIKNGASNHKLLKKIASADQANIKISSQAIYWKSL